MASISKSSRRDPENVSTLLFSATPVSLVVVMMAAEVCWGFRIELPHLCAIALRRPSARLCEQVGGSKRTCSDPASSRTQTGPASVRRGGTIWVDGISDRQMMAVGRAMIFPATSSCSRSCSGGRDGINNRRGNRGLLTTLEQRPCASWEEGWTARGPSTGQRTIPRVKPTIRLSALSKQVTASRPQPLKSLAGLVGLGGSGGHLHRRLCPALGTRGPVGISGIFRGPGRRLARLVGQCRRRRREVVSRHKMVNRGAEDGWLGRRGAWQKRCKVCP